MSTSICSYVLCCSAAEQGQGHCRPALLVPGRLQADARDMLQQGTCCRGLNGLVHCVVGGQAPCLRVILAVCPLQGQVGKHLLETSMGSLHNRRLAYHAHTTCRQKRAGWRSGMSYPSSSSFDPVHFQVALRSALAAAPIRDGADSMSMLQMFAWSGHVCLQQAQAVMGQVHPAPHIAAYSNRKCRHACTVDPCLQPAQGSVGRRQQERELSHGQQDVSSHWRGPPSGDYRHAPRRR